MSVLFRFISLILIVIALMLLGADVVSSLQHNEVTVRSIEQIWALFDVDTLMAFKSWVHDSLPGWFADWVYGVLSMWAFGVAGVLGVIFAFLFGRHRDRIST